MKTITNSFHVGMYIFCAHSINEIQPFLPEMFETYKMNDFSSEVIAYSFKGIDAKKPNFPGFVLVFLYANSDLSRTSVQ